MGCTVVAAFSSQGMLAAHVWEAAGVVDGPDPWINTTNTLHPGNGPAVVRHTLADVHSYLAWHRDKLAGGRLVVILPLWTGEDEEASRRGEPSRKYRYDMMRYEKLKKGSDTFLRDKHGRTKEIQCTGVPEQIKRTVQDSTGLSLHGLTGLEVQYHPANFDMDEHGQLVSKATPEGTFAMVFEPLAAPSSGAMLDPTQKVQVWCDGKQVVFSERS